MNQGALRFAAPLAIGVLMLAAWQAAVSVFEVNPFIVPSPLAVAKALVHDWGILSASLFITLEITLYAFLASVIVGTAVAFLFVQNRLIEVSFFPYVILLQVTPIIAIAPLIIIWVKDTGVALALCATIVAIFPVISNTTIGLRSVDRGLINLFRMHNATRLQTLLRLRVPSALPYFFAGLRVTSGLSLIGAVVAEFVAGTGGAGGGLAYQILVAGFQLNLPRLFAALFLITMAGVLLFLLMSWLSRLALGSWHESELAERT